MAEPSFAELAENEQFILTVTADGYGKRSSAYEYRISGRGGQGITAISLDRPDGKADATVVSSFPVIDSDQVILVTNGGQIIRTPIDTVSIVGRTARGVRLFNVADDEDVVSVSRVREAVDDDEGSEDADPDAIGGDDAVAAGEEGAEGQSAESPEDMSEDAPEEGSGA